MVVAYALALVHALGAGTDTALPGAPGAARQRGFDRPACGLPRRQRASVASRPWISWSFSESDSRASGCSSLNCKGGMPPSRTASAASPERLRAIPFGEVEHATSPVDVVLREPRDRRHARIPGPAGLVAVAGEAGVLGEFAGARAVPVRLSAHRRVGVVPSVGHRLDHDQYHHEPDEDPSESPAHGLSRAGSPRTTRPGRGRRRQNSRLATSSSKRRVDVGHVERLAGGREPLQLARRGVDLATQRHREPVQLLECLFAHHDDDAAAARSPAPRGRGRGTPAPTGRCRRPGTSRTRCRRRPAGRRRAA